MIPFIVHACVMSLYFLSERYVIPFGIGKPREIEERTIFLYLVHSNSYSDLLVMTVPPLSLAERLFLHKVYN